MVDWVMAWPFLGEWMLDGYHSLQLYVGSSGPVPPIVFMCLGAVYYGYSAAWR